MIFAISVYVNEKYPNKNLPLFYTRAKTSGLLSAIPLLLMLTLIRSITLIEVTLKLYQGESCKRILLLHSNYSTMKLSFCDSFYKIR